MSIRTLLCSATFLCLLLLFLPTFLLTESNLAEARGDLCPLILRKLLGGDEKSCKSVTCQTSLTPDSCGKETDPDKRTEFMEKVVMCGCCPACVRREVIQEREECLPKYEDCADKVCPVIIGQCAAGLVCSQDTNTCVKFDDGVVTQECAKKFVLSQTENWEHWTPNCNPDGSYAPLQCKGKLGARDGACFCVDSTGKRIFGRKRWTEAVQNMTCACSLHAHKLRTQGSLLATQGSQISTLHCTLDGSYEALQCDSDSGLCYCVNTVTGKLTGAVMPEKHWTNLPCYSEDEHGTRYLRRCESEMVAAQRIEIEARLHGLELSTYREIDCDYDGSYKSVQRAGDRELCAHKNGAQIDNYQRIGGIGQPMDCKCARAPIEYELEDIPYSTEGKKCETDQNRIGSFRNVQQFGLNAICVDDDGYVYKTVPINALCCLEETGCVPDLEHLCQDPVDPTIIIHKKCSEIEH